ncbi:MAG TPA: SDR family NAD(P)-dependent oxidoreductase [Solirubrobacterales bacterium]|nr:SDR family NAD(P)-dependent oxidoreductase [Solirubrobacterales bacterium]
MSEQRVLITGGTSGIGLAAACRFARGGARVAVLARNQAGLDTTQQQTAAAGSRCLAFSVDVTDRGALGTRVEEAVAGLGGLDVAVVNVGASTYGRFADTPAEDFDRVVDVSFRSVVDTARAVLPHLETSGGSLVVIGSMASELPLPRMSAYTASKHAVRGFVDVLRIELAAQGSAVSLSLVEPGPVDTPFWQNVASADGLLPPSFPLPYGPDEVARAIEGAASARSARATVGGAWVVVGKARRMARPLGDRLLARLMLVAERKGERGPGHASIWNPSGGGELRVGMRKRPSLLVRTRGFAARRRANRVR